MDDRQKIMTMAHLSDTGASEANDELETIWLFGLHQKALRHIRELRCTKTEIGRFY